MPSVETQAEVTLAPDNVESLHRHFDSEWRFRRAFVAGSFPVREREHCRLVVVHPEGDTFAVEAEAVYVKAEEPGAGIGLDLVGLDAGKLADLEAFTRRSAEVPQAAEAPEAESEAPQTTETPEAESEAPNEASNEASKASEPGTRNIYARIRQLTLPERQRVARQGLLSERVALERTFGNSVWEALLQNTGLTVPEVASIAKKGTLPQAMVATIVSNGGWLASGEVRRALLSNPRVNGVQLDRVLRATPKTELKQIAHVSPYRSQVRMAAKKMLSD